MIMLHAPENPTTLTNLGLHMSQTCHWINCDSFPVTGIPTVVLADILNVVTHFDT